HERVCEVWHDSVTSNQNTTLQCSFSLEGEKGAGGDGLRTADRARDVVFGERARRRLVASFFFSSRRRHTRFDCDWSSDVCSSDLSDDFKAHFLGMHFFNPPRYMNLVELIRTEWTKPEVSCSMFGFLDERLGKGVVVAKDRPNFIANRIGTFGALITMRTMLEDSFSVEEVDKITGPAVGRPKTATFRTFDLVGLDVFAHVVKNLHENLPDDPERAIFAMPEFVGKMIERGLLGNKTKAGFYKRQKGEGD